MRNSFLFRILGCLFAVSCCLSCGEADTLYARLPAKFKMENIYQAPVLNIACNSMGEFCIITYSGGYFYFTSIYDQSKVPVTNGYVYEGFYLGLSGGLIVGLPNQIELGKDNVEVVCFDRACRNCYHDYGITKPLQFKENGIVYCKSCERTYNLNDMGHASEGKPLYRYRVRLFGNSLIIAN